MITIRVAANAAVVIVMGTLGLLACNPERKQACDALLGAMKLDDGTPSPDAVDRVRARVEGLTIGDQPLHIYASNYAQTLTVLAGTLRLAATPDAPDGTDDVIKSRLKDAIADREDVTRYCAQ